MTTPRAAGPCPCQYGSQASCHPFSAALHHTPLGFTQGGAGDHSNPQTQGWPPVTCSSSPLPCSVQPPWSSNGSYTCPVSSSVSLYLPSPLPGFHQVLAPSCHIVKPPHPPNLQWQSVCPSSPAPLPTTLDNDAHWATCFRPVLHQHSCYTRARTCLPPWLRTGTGACHLVALSKCLLDA